VGAISVADIVAMTLSIGWMSWMTVFCDLGNKSVIWQCKEALKDEERKDRLNNDDQMQRKKEQAKRKTTATNVQTVNAA
jgi:hypothetical protein